MQSAKDISCSKSDFPVSVFCRTGSKYYTGSMLIFLVFHTTALKVQMDKQPAV